MAGRIRMPTDVPSRERRQHTVGLRRGHCPMIMPVS